MKRKLLYIFILIILVGLFSPIVKLNAQISTPVCWNKNGVALSLDTYSSQAVCEGAGLHWGTSAAAIPVSTTAQCWNNNGSPLSSYGSQSVCESAGFHWGTSPAALPTTPETSMAPTGDALQDAIDQGCSGINPFKIGCLVYASYYIFFVLPASLLAITANLFNSLLALTLSSDLYHNAFIPEAWKVIRDFSNIFFILILLYIAIKVILGLGGSEVKKMIAQVIIMALLINFSMFFTEVVIDTSNVLALIFYNKITITGPNQQPIPYVKNFNSNVEEKDFGGAIASGFNPSAFMDASMFETIPADMTKCPPPQGTGTGDPHDFSNCTDQKPGNAFNLEIIFVSCAIFLFASYAFFIAAISFFGRLVELWVLIIFSPFAFMSSSIPLLGTIEDIGWSSWSKKLLSTAFMAPIFMVFMYLISKIVTINIFKKYGVTTNTGSTAKILLIVIPALIDLILLMKAVKYAKKGGGKFGEFADKAWKLGGGLALGAATGGAAIAGRATFGKVGAAAANSRWAKNWESRGWGGEYARKAATAVGSGSFDLRGIKVAGKNLAGVTGMNVGEAQKGGFIQKRKEQVAKRQTRAKELEVGEDEPLKQELNTAEEALQTLLHNYSNELHGFDEDIKRLKDDFDTAGPAEKQRAADRLNAAKEEKSNFQAEVGITELQRNTIPHAKLAIENESKRRKRVYADTTLSGLGQAKDFLFSGGQHSFNGAREAAHKIRTDAKIESTGDKSHGGGHGGGGGHTAPAAPAAHPAPAAHAPAAHAAPAAAAHGGGHGGGDHGGGHGH